MIPDGLQNRGGAAIVGLAASWWMGLVLGIPIVVVARLCGRQTLKSGKIFRAYGLVLISALIVGLCVLGLAELVTRTSPNLVEGNALGIPYPDGVTDQPAFFCAGAMHDAGYLGGFLGLLLAIGYLIGSTMLRSRRSSVPETTA